MRISCIAAVSATQLVKVTFICRVSIFTQGFSHVCHHGNHKDMLHTIIGSDGILHRCHEKVWKTIHPWTKPGKSRTTGFLESWLSVRQTDTTRVPAVQGIAQGQLDQFTLCSFTLLIQTSLCLAQSSSLCGYDYNHPTSQTPPLQIRYVTKSLLQHSSFNTCYVTVDYGIKQTSVNVAVSLWWRQKRETVPSKSQQWKENST